MKLLYTIPLIVLAGTVYAKQHPDEILACNDVNIGKTEHTILASQFHEMNAEMLDGVYTLLSDHGKFSEVRTF